MSKTVKTLLMIILLYTACPTAMASSNNITHVIASGNLSLRIDNRTQQEGVHFNQQEDAQLPITITRHKQSLIIQDKRPQNSSCPKIGININAPRLKWVELAERVDGIAYLEGPGLLDITTSGYAFLTLRGMLGVSSITSSGSSQINAMALALEKAQVNGSGRSQVKVHALKLLDAQMSGASRLTYAGNPSTHFHSSGRARIIHLEA